MKKKLCLLLAAILALSAVSAFAVEYNAPGTYPICKEKVTLTIAVADNVKIEDFNTNLQTLLMEEAANVDLDFQVYPSTDYSTKINLMISSGDALPDIIIGSFTNAMVYSWAQEGALAPLRAYYEDPAIAYELNKAVERCGTNFFSQMIMPDGEIYAIPTLNQSYGNEFPDKFFIYQPWMEQLNLETPETTEDMYNVLKTIVTSDPNGNGIADEVGITGYDGINGQWFGYLMNAFVYANNKYNFLAVDDGTMYYAYTTDAWKEGLKYIKRMFDEGIIPAETLTQDQTQWKTMINTDDVTCASIIWTSASQVTTGGVERRRLYATVGAMKGPEGVQYATFEPSVCTPTFIISADCKDPETAFRFGDLMVSEYFSIYTRWGKQGEDWDWLENSLINIDDYKTGVEGAEPYFVEYDTHFWSSTQQNSAWMQQGPYIRQYAIANGRVVGGSPKDPEAPVDYGANAGPLYQESGWKPAETFTPLLYNAEESAVINDIQATLSSYVEQKTAAFLVGSLDIDGYWDTYLQELKTIGIDQALAINQGVYDRVYK